MRKKLIFLRFTPIIIIFVLIIFLMQNDLYYYTHKTTVSNSSLSNLNQKELLTHQILDAIDNFNSILFKRAYPKDKVNQTRLYENLKLTKLNLNLFEHLCKTETTNSTFILIGLMSRVDSFERRSLIRKTLGKMVNSSNQRLLFFVGESLNDTVNDLVIQESFEYDDMIKLEFIEDYYNLTLKTLSFLEYFNNYCDQTFKYAIKLDDDVFVNWYGVQDFLLERLSNDKPTIYCKVHQRARVIRDSSNKWYLDHEIYPDPIYPDYCGGPFYVLNKNAVKKVIERHEQVKKKILAFEDAYVTGICTDQTDIQLNSVLTFLSKKDKDFFVTNYLNRKVLAIHPIVDQNYNELFLFIENIYKFL